MIYLKWIGIMIVKGLAFPYSWLFYKKAFYRREEIRANGNKPWYLWIVLDDEEDFGEDWWILKNRYEYGTFDTSWKWAWERNNSWNLNREIRSHIFKNEELVYGFTTSKWNKPLQHCRLKWEILREDGNVFFDGWLINQGDRLSQYYTDFGYAFAIYKEKGTKKPKLWRASYAGIKFGYLLNIKIGFNDMGEALLDFKKKKFKKEYTKHWTK